MTIINLLSIDTSTSACSVAIMQNDQIIAHRWQLAPKSHTQLILMLVDEALHEAKLTLSQLTGLALAVGPGSFTGIRIAAGVVQGLAFGLNLPVALISSLATMAQGAHRLYQSKQVLVVLDAHMQQIYGGAYQLNQHGLMTALMSDCLSTPEEIQFPKAIKDQEWVGIGSGWTVYGPILKEKFKLSINNVYEDLILDAQDIAYLARAKFIVGETVSADKVLPVYLGDYAVGKN
jgi:tRNA threonylcarbamoyladenosine biosynthesis protein TsaB